MTLSPVHTDWALAAGITDLSALRTVTEIDDLPEEVKDQFKRHLPGVLFEFNSVGGRVAYQLRPDRPETDDNGKTKKYIWQFGAPLLFAAPDPIAVGDTSKTLLICEGTKQHLAAHCASGEQFAVVGMFGCWGWRTTDDAGGSPLPDFVELLISKRHVVVILDADMASNGMVWDAAERLGEHLRVVCGAASVKFAKVPGGHKDGLDDVLGRVPEEQRPGVLETIVKEARDKLPKRPPTQTRFLDKGTLQVDSLAVALCHRFGDPALVGEDERLAFYDAARGVWDTSLVVARAWLAGQLSENWNAARRDTVLGYVHDTYRNPESVAVRLPDLMPTPVANFANGVLDLVTGRFWPHPELAEADRKVPTQFVFDVDWDPDAECPHYDAWTDEKLPEPERQQLRDEVFGSVFDLSLGPTQHLILEGPSHTGKSTELHLLTAAVGRNISAEIDPAKVQNNRFTGSKLIGKRLGTCADLERVDMSTVGLLKRITEGDRVGVEKKGLDEIDFEPQSLLVFACNEFPRLPSETSQAFFARFSTVRYEQTHLGREDSSYRALLRAELPGIARRWVEAYRRRLARGSRPTGLESDQLAMRTAANDVARFTAERCEPTSPHDGMRRSAWWEAFKAWFADEYPQGRRSLPGRNVAYAQLASAGFPEVRTGRKLADTGGLALRLKGTWAGGLGEPAAKPAESDPSAGSSAGSSAGFAPTLTSPSASSASFSLTNNEKKKRERGVRDLRKGVAGFKPAEPAEPAESTVSVFCSRLRCGRPVVEGTEYCERHSPPDAPCIVCGAALSTPQQLAQGKCGLTDQAHATRWSKLSPGYTP